MGNQTATYSLAKIAGKKHDGSLNQILVNKFSSEEMESITNGLLHKNTQLAEQLKKALLKISRLKRERRVLLDEIDKATKEDDFDDDDDNSELSAGDIESDIDSSEEELEKEYDNIYKAEPIVIESTPKRRRLNAPKRPRGDKPVEVKKDKDGNYILPAQIGRITLLSLGEIIPDENFFNQNYIFPVGFATQKTYKSMVQEDVYTTYTCSIEKDEQNKPLFCIEAKDAPEIVIKKSTPTAAWSEVLRRSNILRKKEFKNTVSGPEYYGLSLTTIKKLIQELPGAQECIGYQWINE